MNRDDLPAPNATCVVCDHKYRMCKRCIELRFRGVEAWRMYCDSPECYQVYVFSNEDPAKVTKEEYDRVMEIELPEGRKVNKATKEKLDAIKKTIDYNNYSYTNIKNNSEKDNSSNGNTKYDKKYDSNDKNMKSNNKGNDSQGIKFFRKDKDVK